ncbi:MAG: hypothetical protein ACRCUE_01980 [Bosea sp. (in: a-proteobacteria)]
MSPQEINQFTELTQSKVTKPQIDELTILRFADDTMAETKVEALAKNQMAGTNVVAEVMAAEKPLTLWENTLKVDYGRLDGRRRGTDAFSIDTTNERLFRLAPFYAWLQLLIAVLVVGGLIILFNTISATISGSAVIPSLVDSPWRAAMWAFLPICGMLAGHMMHHTAVRDSIKRVIMWTLLVVVLICALAWSMIYVFAFPQDGVAQAVTNVFETAAGGESNVALKALIAVQLIGEIAFGGAVGIYLEHLATRGYATTVTPNKAHLEYDGQQRELLQDLAKATRLRGMASDYARRYAAEEAVFVTRCLAFLKEAQLRLLVARGAATLHVINH